MYWAQAVWALLCRPTSTLHGRCTRRVIVCSVSLTRSCRLAASKYIVLWPRYPRMCRSSTNILQNLRKENAKSSGNHSSGLVDFESRKHNKYVLSCLENKLPILNEMPFCCEHQLICQLLWFWKIWNKDQYKNRFLNTSITLEILPYNLLLLDGIKKWCLDPRCVAVIDNALFVSAFFRMT